MILQFRVRPFQVRYNAIALQRNVRNATKRLQARKRALEEQQADIFIMARSHHTIHAKNALLGPMNHTLQKVHIRP